MLIFRLSNLIPLVTSHIIDALLGLNVSLLRDVSFYDCDIGDEEVISLAHDCPYISEICLNDCKRVTDASMIALAKCCVHLIAIDIGKCMSITEDGLVAFASSCSSVRTENHLLYLDTFQYQLQ